MMTVIHLLGSVLGGIAMASSCLAQWPAWSEDGWVASFEFFIASYITPTLQPQPSLPGSIQRCVIADGPRVYVLGWPQVGYFNYDVSAPNWPWDMGHAVTLAAPYVHWDYGCCTRDRLWMWDGFTRDFGWTPKVGPAQIPQVIANSRAAGISGAVDSVTSDGRDLYFSVEVTANDRFHIWAVDLRDPTHPVRPIIAMPGSGTPRRGPALAMGRGGALLAMDDPRLYSIDVPNRRLRLSTMCRASLACPRARLCGKCSWPTIHGRMSVPSHPLDRLPS